MLNIRDKLQNHIEYFSQRYPEYSDNIIGNFLYGSQNYGLSTSGSDVDSILLYDGDPIRDLFHSSIRIGIEDIKLFNIETMCNKLRNLFLPMLEAFCTEYINIKNENIVSLIKEFSIDELCNNAKDLLLTNLNKKLLEHTTEINHLSFFEDRPDNLLYNKKRLYWAMRVYDSIVRIQEGETFSQILIPNNKELLLNIKNGVKIPLQQVVDFRNKAWYKIKELNQLQPIIPKINVQIINEFENSITKEIR